MGATLSVVGSVNTSVFLFYVQEIDSPTLGRSNCRDGQLTRSSRPRSEANEEKGQNSCFTALL